MKKYLFLSSALVMTMTGAFGADKIITSANIAHAKAVSGNDYFGTGVDTCYATACDKGYHVDGGGVSLVEKDPLVPISLTDEGIGSAAVDIDGDPYNYNFSDSGLTEKGTWATKYAEGIVYGKASCQPKIKDAGLEYLIANESSLMSGGISLEEFKTAMLPLVGQVKTDYAVEILTGVMTGSISMEEMYKAIDVVFGSDYEANYSTDSTGQYCYCQMDGFLPTGGTKEIVTSAPWVFGYDYGSADDCAGSCAGLCAYGLRFDDANALAFRGAVVGSLGAVSAGGTCAANTININWDPANGNAATANQCTYDGEITLPTPDPVKPGYTFMGWKLKTEN